jgi:hypothetical protein
LVSTCKAEKYLGGDYENLKMAQMADVKSWIGYCKATVHQEYLESLAAGPREVKRGAGDIT